MDDKVIFGNICSTIMSQLFIAEANINFQFYCLNSHNSNFRVFFFSGSAKDAQITEGVNFYFLTLQRNYKNNFLISIKCCDVNTKVIT